MSNSIIIRKIGNEFGIFNFPGVELIGMVPDEISLQNLLQDVLYTVYTKKEKPLEFYKEKTWPEVGRPYWFVNAPNPLNISVNQGTITPDLMEEIKNCENGKYGNMFQTKGQAIEMAKKLAELFE